MERRVSSTSHTTEEYPLDDSREDPVQHYPDVVGREHPAQSSHAGQNERSGAENNAPVDDDKDDENGDELMLEEDDPSNSANARKKKRKKKRPEKLAAEPPVVIAGERCVPVHSMWHRGRRVGAGHVVKRGDQVVRYVDSKGTLFQPKGEVPH